MITFPHCKINIGLDIVARRPDGYHDIDTLMYPVRGLYDSLEIVPDPTLAEPELTVGGNAPDCAPQDNIVYKAWKLLDDRFRIGGCRIYLRKAVPFGAGLGGGSADGAFALRMLDALYDLRLGGAALAEAASRLGSDVPFFIQDAPRMCSGRGEVMAPSPVDLSGYTVAIVKPDIFVSTAEAYAGTTPRRPRTPLAERLSLPVGQWRGTMDNAFEETVFARHPQLAAVKAALYDAGAEYASMSGSGSALYGLFRGRPLLPEMKDCSVHVSELG